MSVYTTEPSPVPFRSMKITRYFVITTRNLRDGKRIPRSHKKTYNCYTHYFKSLEEKMTDFAEETMDEKQLLRKRTNLNAEAGEVAVEVASVVIDKQRAKRNLATSQAFQSGGASAVNSALFISNTVQLRSLMAMTCEDNNKIDFMNCFDATQRLLFWLIIWSLIVQLIYGFFTITG